MREIPVSRDDITCSLVILRRPGQNFAQGITTSELGEPAYEKMVVQYRSYARLLKSLGIEIVVLEPLESYPDAYFVEDTAVIMPELAVMCRPGAKSRRGEVSEMEPVLSRYRPISHIQSPGTLEGGDVLKVNNHFFVGISERTNEQGVAQFGQQVTDLGYTWTPVPVSSGLHLKSSVNYVGKDTLLLTAEYTNRQEFQNFKQLILPVDELEAANTLYLNGRLIIPAGFPKTKALLSSLDLEIFEIDVSEARKMDGGLTCMSLRL